MIETIATVDTAHETLMFLPGASGNTELWRPLSDRLVHFGAREFLGWPGFGPTPPQPGITSLTDLVQLVTHKVSSPVTLLAQSMGGVIAVMAALELPKLVRRLVLSVTSGGLDLASLGAVDWRPEFRKCNPDLPRWFEDYRTDLTSRLHELTAPVLLLWGDSDPISPIAVGEHLANLLPNAELLVVEGGTHSLVKERTDQITPHVQRHLSKHVIASTSQLAVGSDKGR